MSEQTDRLYELLPVIYRQHDADKGYPLRAVLRVISQEVDIVESDIAQLYENWFIETAQDWVVPYIGDLVGYRPVHEAGEPGEVNTPQGRARNKILISRREVANTIRYRRRKGTLALLELLANDVAGWPTRAVEFYKLLSFTQALNHQRQGRGRTADLRCGDALDRLAGPFEEMAHTVDVHRINSHYARGKHNIPSVGVFVWRLKVYSVTYVPAKDQSPYGFTFSILSNNIPLFVRPEPQTEPTQIAGELNLPVAIRRRAFEERVVEDDRERVQASSAYYGLVNDTLIGKSLAIWALDWPSKGAEQPIPRSCIVPANLSDWQQYQPPYGKVAVDPVLGRIAFPPGQRPSKGVRVSYHYGFSNDIGGGEYDRPISQSAESVIIQVKGQEQLRSALEPWQEEKSLENQPVNAVIEIMDSGIYMIPNLSLKENHSLQIRAANRTRPVIRLSDIKPDLPDNLIIYGEEGSRFLMDGLMITGQGVQIEGDLSTLVIRHSTLVPGWSIAPECEPALPIEASLDITNAYPCVVIEHSILGSIQVNLDEVKHDPIQIRISDSIVDATGVDCDSPECKAIFSTAGSELAHATVRIVRSTVIGHVLTHAICLAENSIFMSRVAVLRRQIGCMRFCYVAPGSCTPRRYNCQPDLVEKKVAKEQLQETEEALEVQKKLEGDRVKPVFNSMRYGTPTYCQLALMCAEEILRGADDESEMGVFHDLYQPQRTANLRARLEEYTPAGAEVGIIFSS